MCQTPGLVLWRPAPYFDQVDECRLRNAAREQILDSLGSRSTTGDENCPACYRKVLARSADRLRRGTWSVPGETRCLRYAVSSYRDARQKYVERGDGMLLLRPIDLLKSLLHI